MAQTTVSLSPALSRACACACAERLTAGESRGRMERAPSWNRERRTWNLGTSGLPRESEQPGQAHTPHANRTLRSPWRDSAATCIMLGLENRLKKISSRLRWKQSRTDVKKKKKSASTASEAMRQGERCLDMYLLGHISPSHGPMHAQQGEYERPSWPQPGGRGCGEPRGGTSKQQLQNRHDEHESPSDLRLWLYKVNPNDGRTRPALTCLDGRRCTKKSVADQWTARTSLH